VIEVKFTEKPCGCPRLSDAGKEVFLRLAMDMAVERAYRSNGMGYGAFIDDDLWFKKHWFKKIISILFLRPRITQLLKPSEYYRKGYLKAFADVRTSLLEIK